MEYDTDSTNTTMEPVDDALKRNRENYEDSNFDIDEHPMSSNLPLQYIGYDEQVLFINLLMEQDSGHLK
ncbi:hypothetical protein L1987_53205 [Smallanthus sonchifolius]|uniref:Uncharacterized protein n=1 Tax=Smallanthus sonchifolius TaxID=185202 RepID=A0ACB9EUY6_9ASTR|nr:hypothetical protein L1987_53205 [Smallanthus sonchifolius]